MSTSILGSVTLGYQMLWNQLRQLCAVQLSVQPHPHHALDAHHLLAALAELWPQQAPTLLLSVQSVQLLSDLLDHAPAGSPWVEVAAPLLADPAMVKRVQQAHQRGVKLVWRGELGTRPDTAMAPCFHKSMLSLTTEETLLSLRVSLKKHHDRSTGAAARMKSPVVADQIYESIASQVLTEHCLDEQRAWSVVGWPAEDILHGYRQQIIQPGHRAIVKLVEALDADLSTEAIEHLLGEEPLLAYRFLRFCNSASLGLRTEIASLRHGLMVLGYSTFKNWLLEQLPHASSDLNLQPIRTSIVVRARLMEHLLDAGDGDDLRREVHLCGLLSQIDLLLGESPATALQRLPVSERVSAAILNGSGPYSPYLEVATALESPVLQDGRSACQAHGFSTEEVNRALLRTLALAQPHPARGLLLV